MAQGPGTEAQEKDQDAQLPVVGRWAALIRDRHREEVEGTRRSPLRRLIARARAAPSRLSWKGREWLRERPLLPRRNAAGRPGSPDPHSGDAWLVPILVDCFGRDGSTLMMRLLANSPQIAVGSRYPYEHRYFTYLWRWSRLLDRPNWPHDVWGSNEVCSVTQEANLPLLGPPPWLPRDLMKDSEPMSSRCFELTWREFSRRAGERTRVYHRRGAVEARYYAEKHLDTWNLKLEELPPVKLLVLLRDPRDVWVSVRAFERKKGDLADFRVGGTLSHDDLLRYQIARQRVRLRWIAELLESEDHPVVRYEDLVRDLPAVADRIERWLGVSLDTGKTRERDREFNRHGSAGSPESSIGRWKDELDPAVAELFTKEIGPELRLHGFEG
ncbi:MAG: sulfotransferase [Solirubrobacterales bacterium]